MSKAPESRLARRMQSRGDVIIGSSTRALHRAGVRVTGRLVSASGDAVQFSDGARMTPVSVIWATGFHTDYSWIDIPGALRGGGPRHEQGIGAVAGLYFLGLPGQHSRGSALLGFVKDDAAWLEHRVTARQHDVKHGLGAPWSLE